MALSPNYLNGIAPLSQSAGLVNFASGSYVGGWVAGDGAGALPIVVNVGFTPRYVKLLNATIGDSYEWFEGMAATKTAKSVAAGTVTFDATSVIVTNSTVVTVTEMATAPPGSQSPGYGTTGTVQISYANPALNQPQLVFNSAAAGSGAPCNTNGTLYLWMAMG